MTSASATVVNTTVSDVPQSPAVPSRFTEDFHGRPGTGDSHTPERSDSSIFTPAPSRPMTPRITSSHISIPTTTSTTRSIVSPLPTPSLGIQSLSTSSPYFPDVQGAERNSNSDLPRPSIGSRITRDSFMSPPARPLTIYQNISTSLSPTKLTKRNPSTMLAGEIEKPWLTGKNTHSRIAYYLTYAVAALGIFASVFRCYFGWKGVSRIGNLCLVMDDNFDTFNSDIWTHEVALGGFGNGEFEMTTNSPNNSFVRDGKLYIMPTLTSDIIGSNSIFNGYTYNLTGCTSSNSSVCGVVSNSSTSTVINPVQSARITTRYSHNIQFGKVEINAKLPRGDWLWPALWMLPVDSVYGPWPMSGEIDIMEARGNGPTYISQGVDVVRGSLNWGPFTWLNRVYKTYGSWSLRRASYDQGFHTYTLEWAHDFMRIYVDTRLHFMLTLNFGESFWQRGQFPQVVQNGTEYIALQDPWINGTNASPFDKPFYLIMNVAVGGTNGWFPDGVGNKPWLDGSLTAMHDFAQKQEEWYSTWPQGDDRALIVDSVKMWQKC